MHFSMQILPYLFLLKSQYSQATPIAQGPINATPCVISSGDRKSYTITEQKDVEGDPQQLPYFCTPMGDASCTVGRSKTFSVAVTVEVGLELGLDFAKIATAGLTAGVSISTEEGTTDAAEVECKGPWACGLLMTPTLHEVKGIQTTTAGTCAGDTTEAPYTVRFPVKVDKTIKAGFEACACKNKLSWADAEAPKPCPNDC